MKSLSALALAALGVAAIGVTPAAADNWNKTTFLTVNETIQVPGAVLPPGKYVVRLLDSPSNRHIVQFLNEDRTKLITTVLAIPNERMQPAGETQLRFYETTGNEPPALRAWFYPGDNFGQQFVYPKEQARVLARSSGRYVPTMDDDAIGQLRVRDVNAMPAYKETRIYVWSPQDSESAWEQGFENDYKADQDKKWMERQNRYSRYGEFWRDQNQNLSQGTGQSDRTQTGTSQPSSTTTRSMTSQTTTMSRTTTDGNTTVWRGYEVLPTNLNARRAEADAILRTLGTRGDQFKDDFKRAIRSSTVKMEDRDELVRMVDRMTDRLKEVSSEYKQNDMSAAHKELGRALEAAALVNRFMLRSEMGSVGQSWAALRDDLNTLATIHTIPVIPVIVVERTTAAR
jgi:hypothetical protein